MSAYIPTERTQVRRLKKRAAYDKEVVHAILDQAIVCHVGFVANQQPFVIPTLFARDDETLYLHGSGASRMLRSLAAGLDVCLTVTLVDGVVLARSAFHHSLNYRSVVVIGKARLVTDREEMLHALHLLTNHVVSRRWEEVRTPNELELKQTHVLALPLTEVSAKIRTGPPLDDEEDYALPVWAGVVPVRMNVGAPIDDNRLSPNTEQVDLSRFGPVFGA
jgi:nitroimidazol reductase NimA-like FMN-containing flavoprotein (pyridoxamine 5'-phosphate oxidase superfamily)